ncbi:MAG: aspartate aminotransferase family protein, partial [Thermoflexibacteraceae bacterium]
GGHAVISIGHSHPHYIQRIEKQLHKIAFYSNSVQNTLQNELAEKLGKKSGYDNYQLFLCNSGAEANENALKMASFHTQKKKVIAFQRAFHGRTSAAVATTDNPKIVAPINAQHEVIFIEWENLAAVQQAVLQGDIGAVIIEGIQGVGGIHVPSNEFLQGLAVLCQAHDIVLIVDEIQSGYGRTGEFFAHQHAGIQPDIITIAKGMGNGFPVAGVLLHPKFQAKEGLLGTTFGGNHLACVAALAVLEVMDNEYLVENAQTVGNYLKKQLQQLQGIKEIRGKGLMLGVEFDFPIKNLRNQLLFKYHIFTGVAGTHTLRLLPPLNLHKTQVEAFAEALQECLREEMVSV